MGRSHGRDATLDEVLAAIEAIDAAGFLMLRACAAGRLFGTRFRDPNDLVQDALLSVVEGAQPGSSRKGRKWPVSVPFMAFLTNAMKGIASNDRESIATKSEVLATELVGDDGGDADEALATVSSASGPGADETLMDAAEAADLLAQRDALFEFFAGDVSACLPPRVGRLTVRVPIGQQGQQRRGITDAAHAPCPRRLCARNSHPVA